MKDGRNEKKKEKNETVRYLTNDVFKYITFLQTSFNKKEKCIELSFSHFENFREIPINVYQRNCFVGLFRLLE